MEEEVTVLLKQQMNDCLQFNTGRPVTSTLWRQSYCLSHQPVWQIARCVNQSYCLITHWCVLNTHFHIPNANHNLGKMEIVLLLECKLQYHIIWPTDRTGSFLECHLLGFWKLSKAQDWCFQVVMRYFNGVSIVQKYYSIFCVTWLYSCLWRLSD